MALWLEEFMRAKDRGISTAYYEAIAPTYDEAKEDALRGIRLSPRDVRFKEVDAGPDGVRVRAISIRTRLDEAKRDLRLFLDGFGFGNEISGYEEAGLIFLNVEGVNMGILIGRGGLTLEAIEYLLNVIHNRRFTPQRYVILDIGCYRAQQLQYLEGLIAKAVQHINYRQKIYMLPPMSAKSRKLIHILLNKYPGYESKSAGEEPRRWVEIMPAATDECESKPEPSSEDESDWDEEVDGLRLE